MVLNISKGNLTKYTKTFIQVRSN